MALFVGLIMKKFTILLAILIGSNVSATTLHFSPEIRIGPYIGSGISGGGAQLGLTDVWGMDAVYLSYSHTSSEFLNIDKDRIKTYRVGVQHNIPSFPAVGFQVELGGLKYEGERDWWAGQESVSSTGVSSTVSAVYNFNDHLGVRMGMDINYIPDMASEISSMFSTGVILRF